MTNEQIMKLADGYTFTWDEDVLKFARAVERQALERAAEMCVALSNGYVSDVNPDRSRTAAAAATMCARQIQRLIEQSASKEKQHG